MIKRLTNQLELIGHALFYLTLRLLGHRGGSILLVPVVFSYLLFSCKIHKTVRPYFQHRFPGERWYQYWAYAYKNIYSFGHVLVDRGWLGIKQSAQFEGEFIGYETLAKLMQKKQGVVLLTAHVGNWQAALAQLGKLPIKVHALMQYNQQAVAKHYFDMKGQDKMFEIIDADGPFGGMIEAAAALQQGEIVTIMGDRLVKGSSSKVNFFGSPVRLPNAAYWLAATSNAPVVIVLAAKTGQKQYQLKIWDYFTPQCEQRDKRSMMLQQCSQRYARTLEKYLKCHPFQWYNFYHFWKQ